VRCTSTTAPAATNDHATWFTRSSHSLPNATSIHTHKNYSTEEATAASAAPRACSIGRHNSSREREGEREQLDNFFKRRRVLAGPVQQPHARGLGGHRSLLVRTVLVTLCSAPPLTPPPQPFTSAFYCATNMQHMCMAQILCCEGRPSLQCICLCCPSHAIVGHCIAMKSQTAARPLSSSNQHCSVNSVVLC